MGLYEGEGLLSGGGGAYNRNEIFVGRYMGLYPGELIHGGGLTCILGKSDTIERIPASYLKIAISRRKQSFSCSVITFSIVKKHC